ncbi:unnamed protein product [Adineta ricciae]|uniref:MULE transposase domain-containing protein n=1 Tax=Adineta ricciae TaxID=249248 RepID=A0A815ZQ86_ADIRI|nr:unnamed protein product [Adineta ricciae]
MLVFASTEQLKVLFNSPIILMDGTFSSSPTIFDQVYCIHAIKFEQSFVCVFALLSDRKKGTYKLLFQELRNKAVELNMSFNPNIVMSDFEGCLRDILKTDFPNSQHLGCYFHYTQAIYRNIQALGLSRDYGSDEEIRCICRKIMALPLIPISLVSKAYDDLLNSTIACSRVKYDMLRPLFNYFENQWMRKVDIQQWNVYGMQMRTNNNAEGYHNRLNSRMSKYHPNIWAFIQCIKGEENRFNHLLIQMKGGLAARPKTKKTCAIQNRIDTLYLRYENNDINSSELLEGLSYVVAKNIKSRRK